MDIKNRDRSLEGPRKDSEESDICLDCEGWAEFGPVVVGGRDGILGKGKNMNIVWNQERSGKRACDGFGLEHKLYKGG